jgi:phosphate transport system permease protein
MTATLTGPPAPVDPVPDYDIRTSTMSLGRRLRNLLASVFMVAAFVTALIPLGMVAWTVISKGAEAISWDFLTKDIPRQYREVGPGMGPAIVGTIVMTAIASLLAIPLGVLGAVYLSEYGQQRPFARLVRTMADVMTGVPSIVMGLFVFVAFVLPLGQKSGLAGGLALACLMLPIVIRSTEEILRLVPEDLRAASAALGARRWKTTTSVVLPAALSGITSGAMLAVARAAGETAPLIATAGLVYTSNWSASGENTALAAQIFRNASQPFPGAQQRAWGAALTLIVIVFVFTLAARVISSRFSTARP